MNKPLQSSNNGPMPFTGTTPSAPETGAGSRVRRPVQAVKVGYTSAWLHFLIVFCLIVAWWFPAKILFTQLVWPRHESKQPRDAYAFVALAYEGVSKNEGEVKPAQFREHLAALRAAGYSPVTLEDVRALVREGRPVPRKSVLVSFDHARKTSYFAVHSILRKNGWPAVMFLWTKPVVDRDPASLLWPYIKSMARSRIWEIGAQSHDGFHRIPTSSRGRLGNFMTSPKWLDSEKRFESLDEFHRRLQKDHQECLAVIEEEIGHKPMAYAYPYGDFGQFQSRAIMTRPVNLALVEKNYPLGFITGNLAVNTRHSDPRRLNRLMVRPEWSGADLVAYLEKSWPVEGPQIQAEGGMSPGAWIVDWGSMERDVDGSLVMFAPTNTTGAKMWLAGSDLNRDFYARTKFRLDRGQLGLYFRASADGESYVYLGIDAGGEVWLRQMNRGKDTSGAPESMDEVAGIWLRQKQVSAERFTLASSRVKINPTSEHTLEVFLRERLLFAHLDGHEIFRSRSMLRGELKPGMFGLSVWSPENGVARAHISEVALQRQSPTLASWTAKPSDEPYVFRWIYANAYRLTQLSPAWMQASVSGPVVQPNMDFDIYGLLARVNHLRLYPQLLVDDQVFLPRIAPSLLADRVAAVKADGLFVNMTAMRDVTAPMLVTWIRQCGRALQEKKLAFLLQLPETLENRASIQSILAVVPSASIVVKSDSPVKDDPSMRNTPVVARDEVPPPALDEELPLFYMIQGVPETTATETQEAKVARLQQEGLASFLDAQYAKAVELWKEWLAIEPDNSKALSLIGDGLVRLGDLKNAVSFYDRSLDVDPGQISLAIRRVGLFTTLGQKDKAISSLNLYARLFPDNAEILLAQAEWLFDNGRAAEAREVAQRVLKVDGESIAALTMVLRLTPPAESGYAASMKKLAELGSKPEYQLDLGQAMWKHEIAAMPHAEALNRMTREIVKKTKDQRVAEIFGRLAPRTDVATDTFADGRLSNRWWLEGGTCQGKAGVARFAVNEGYSEASMRLLGSLHLRNAFIEATVSDVKGGFWLCTSRTSDHIARFGFTDDGFIYLQIRRGNRLVGERKIAWQQPAGRVRLRMEAGGDGIMGYVDGVPVFNSRLFMPEDIGLGWIGASVFAPNRGRASASIYSLSGGPLPVRLAMLGPVATTEDADVQLQQVRPDVTLLASLCPSWYTVGETGKWVDGYAGDKQIHNVFARYHRVWLTPVVEVSPGVELAVEEMEARALEAKADGFVLMFRDWPGDAWFVSMRDKLRQSKLRVLVGVPDAAAGVMNIRGIGRGTELTAGVDDALPLQLVPKANLAAKLPNGLAAEPGGVMIGY